MGFERKILSFFNGKFWTYTNYLSVNLNPDQGSLELIFEHQLSVCKWEKESLLIKAGEKNKLGKLSTKQFMLPGREVYIYDFRIDLEKLELNLLGSCSSIVKDCDIHPMKINLCPYPDDDDSASLRIETMLYHKSKE